MIQLCLYELKNNLSTLSVTFCLFLLYIILIPCLIGFSPDLLYHYHLGIIWMCILFCFVPERFFQQDFADGSMELYFLSSCSIQPILTSKLLGYWLLKISGILCSFPILGFVYHLEQSKQISLTLILGSFVFTLICAVYSGFTIQLQSNGWISIQHFATFPILFPLIILCTYIQAQQIPFAVLLGFVCLFFNVYWVFVPITFHKILSH